MVEKTAVELDWFINSRCDYTCSRCTPHAGDDVTHPLNLEQCLEALNGYADFAHGLGKEASITFYPRQAPFTEPFTSVLREAAQLKSLGKLKYLRSANRGDLPADKAKWFKDNGIDVCLLTFDGPEPVQNFLRRPDSFRDTLAAFHRVKDLGMQLSVLLIVIRYELPHVVETIRLLLEQGFDDFVLQAAIRHGQDAYPALPSKPPGNEFDTLWNRHPTTAEYRTLLAGILELLDALPASQKHIRDKFVLENPLYARLFFETGRQSEYAELCGKAGQPLPGIKFQLKSNGELFWHPAMPKAATFPGASFVNVFENTPMLQLQNDPSLLRTYMEKNRKEFAKCRTCPAAEWCPPQLAAAGGSRAYFYSDDRCWVSE